MQFENRNYENLLLNVGEIMYFEIEKGQIGSGLVNSDNIYSASSTAHGSTFVGSGGIMYVPSEKIATHDTVNVTAIKLPVDSENAAAGATWHYNSAEIAATQEEIVFEQVNAGGNVCEFPEGEFIGKEMKFTVTANSDTSGYELTEVDLRLHDTVSIYGSLLSDDTNVSVAEGEIASDVSGVSAPTSLFYISETIQAFVGGYGNLTWSDFEKGYSGYYYKDESIVDAEKCRTITQDDMMCWAAAASNMLSYAGWDLYRVEDDEDNVFNKFVENFTLGKQYGGGIYYAINWYFTGKYSPAGWSEWDQPLENSGGLYKSTFSNLRFRDYCYTQSFSVTTLNNAKDKLNAGYAVGVSFGYYNDNRERTGGHAITLWGMTCDITKSSTDLGYYTGIIVSDSDDNKGVNDPTQAPDVLKIISITYDSSLGKYVLDPSYAGKNCWLEDLYFLAPNTSGFVQDSATRDNIKIYKGSSVVSKGSDLTGAIITGAGNDTMKVSAGGIALRTNINTGGVMHISSGGVGSNTINTGGVMYISADGMHKGSLQITGGGIVSAYSGAVIDFTVSERSARDGYLISDLSAVYGTPAFTITILANQAWGEYKLAQGAENFSTAITIGTADANYGIIAVNGDKFSYKNVDYLLKNTSGNLILFIGDLTRPILSISGNATVPTNKNITLTATASDGTIEFYNGTRWILGGVQTVSENGTYIFRATDAAGNVTEQTVVVDKIDKIAPTIEITGVPVDWTNQDVTLTAVVSDGAVEYFSNGKWIAGSSLKVTENGTYSFRVTDEAGNVTEQKVTVNKIDKDAPSLKVTGNPTEWTNQNITLTATISDGILEFYNGTEWISGAVQIISENGIYKYRVSDVAGNVTEETVVVDKIDKAPPTLEITGNATTPTNKDIVLTAVASDGNVEYFDGEKWVSGDKITVAENGTFIFRVTDLAGNVTEKSVVVDMIDKIAPTLEITGNAEALTNQDVVLSAAVSDGTVEYLAGDQWVTGSTLTVTENGTYTFRVTDLAGNVTEKSVIVDMIDKVAPTLEITGNAEVPTNQDITLNAVASDGTVEYLAGDQWVTGSTLTVTENGIYLFRATDDVGNVTEKRVEVTNIDKIAPVVSTVTANIAVLTNRSVKVTATFAAEAVLNEYSVNGGEWEIYEAPVVFTENGSVLFRCTDAAGNVSETVSYQITNIDSVADNAEIDYNFVKKSFNVKSNGKTQNGFVLRYGINAFADLSGVVTGSFAVLLDAKNTISTIPENIETIAGNVATATGKTGSYKAVSTPKNTLNLNGIDTGDVEFIRFATVNVTDGAVVGNVDGGKETISETVKSTLKNGIATKTVTFSHSVTASGKVTVTNATAGNISGYSAVTLDNGVAGELVNSNVKISKSDKTVGGKDDTITHTTTYSASGTATLKNGSYVDSISGFKTVKLTASTVGEIVLGDSYTEKFTLKKGVETPSSKKTYTGTVTLENATVGSIAGMNKVTASKGFNAIASYTGSDGNDTLTINKNAVLALGAVDMGAGAKDKFVNNGTLVLTGDFDRSFISGKGEIVAASDVYETLENCNGVLNLGATAEGFRTTKYENSDDAIKKAVKWDLKAGDYTGWLGSWQSGSDNVDFIKFTIGKNDVDKELCVSGVENFTLFDKKGNEVDIISAAGTYTLKLELDSTESTSYTLALA